MKKIVLAGFAIMFAFAAGAQTFKKGESVEVNRDLADDGSGSWSDAKITDMDLANGFYTLKTFDKKIYRIPFAKEHHWMRRPMQPLTTSLRSQEEVAVFSPSVDLLKQKIKEQFESDFSEYDSVIISFENIETLPGYKNTDEDFAKAESEIYPYKVDFTLRLVNKNSDGSVRKINWQFKRKYLLYQNKIGKCGLTVADKEEQVLSHI